MPISELLFAEQIKTMPAVQAKYLHPAEAGINPAYEDIDHCTSLCLNEKRIWVLRSDLTLALGIKNGALKYGNTNILDKIDASMHGLINPDNRYGHPSLALPEGVYDGSVYYAGWLRKQSDRIEIFLSSGRFQNAGLNKEKIEIIEAYIAFKLMSVFGKQTIIFFDWITETNDVEFPLFLSCEPFTHDRRRRSYTPRLISLINEKLYSATEKTSDALLAYQYDMEISKIETSLCFHRLIEELKREKLRAELDLHRLEKLALARADDAEPYYPCFDDFWLLIQSAFDGCMDPSYTPAHFDPLKEHIKKAMYLLLDCGIAHVDGRNICLWTSKFARNKAIEFAHETGSVTDGMAQLFLRKIFYGYPGFSESLYKMLNTYNPTYPLLSRIFTEAILELFVDALNPTSEVHVFFQDSLSTNNYFWNIELPIARKKGAKVFLHPYDLSKKEWSEAVEINSVAANNIFLRRRTVHPLDKATEADFILEKGERIWKKEFSESDDQKPLEHWSAPRRITLGKMHSIFCKMRHYKRAPTPHPEELELKSDPIRKLGII